MVSSNGTTTNGHSHSTPRPLLPGCYVPTFAFFDAATEDLDLATTASHAVRLAKAGVTGIVTQGSNGEAVHLTHAERFQITQTTRHALDAAGFTSVPVLAGCGAQSVRETVELCVEARDAGADAAMVLPPSYFKNMFTATTVEDFFADVCAGSPIPVLIYNYPGVVSGLDLDSDAITRLAARCPNLRGVKLTCGNTGKLNRIAAATHASTPAAPVDGGFLCLGGSADFTLPALIGGGSGTIVGLANIAPAACSRLVELWRDGKVAEAQKLQAVVARGDWAVIAGGIVGGKSALQSWFGYGGFGRRPLPRPTETQDATWKAQFEELVALEKTLVKGL